MCIVSHMYKTNYGTWLLLFTIVFGCSYLIILKRFYWMYQNVLTCTCEVCFQIRIQERCLGVMILSPLPGSIFEAKFLILFLLLYSSLNFISYFCDVKIDGHSRHMFCKDTCQKVQSKRINDIIWIWISFQRLKKHLVQIVREMRSNKTEKVLATCLSNGQKLLLSFTLLWPKILSNSWQHLHQKTQVEMCKGSNEMVSLGDTAISLHILQPSLNGGWWGVSEVVKTLSAKICLISIFGEGRGVGVLKQVPEQGVLSEDFEHKFCLATFWMPLHHR